MHYNFWQILSTIINNEGGYIGKAKKAAWANEQAIADKQAAVLREQIASQEKIMKEQTEATMKASKDSAIAGVIGAALGAHTTTEQIKQLLPHESGAATLMSYDLAEKWNTTLDMKTKGYSNVAIDYALQGNNYRALYKDSKYNSAMFVENQRKDLVSSLQTFGIQSAGNPAGIAMSSDEWIKMHSVKDAHSMLEVDPVQAHAREEQFKKWESEMRASGKGLLVDLYKNPQLAGANIMAMKGPDPLIPKEMMPLLSSVAGEGGGNVNWGDILKQMNAGETNEHTEQIKWAMDNGILDKYGQINGGALMQNIPPDLQQPLAYDPHRVLTPEETATLLNDYNKLSQIKVDPKLVQEQQLGMGVVAKTKLNADGTVSGKYMSGYMTNQMGEQINVTVQGDNLNDWMRKQTDAMSGLGPLFPQFFAMQDSATSGDRTKTLTNQLATANGGSKDPYQSTDALGAQAQKQKDQGTAPKPVTMPTTSPVKPPLNNGQAGQVTTAPGQPPAGYSGAPLAAGE